ncbi:hypothetical protein BKA69DRAFT_1129013 [Paraphysoderma sedebokerense]|nr:hypothetical protein BKA69DRAFT_1129013 [Paraphysoderma sedebokerense]
MTIQNANTLYLFTSFNPEKAGYKDGIVEGKDVTIQQGFNHGYEEASTIAYRLGSLRGSLSAIHNFYNSRPDLLAQPSSNTHDRVENESILKELTTLISEMETLSVENVFSKNYIKESMNRRILSTTSSSTTGKPSTTEESGLQQQDEPLTNCIAEGCTSSNQQSSDGCCGGSRSNSEPSNCCGGKTDGEGTSACCNGNPSKDEPSSAKDKESNQGIERNNDVEVMKSPQDLVDYFNFRVETLLRKIRLAS